jgi:hypothetical protein
MDHFFDPVMLEYNGNYAEFQVACDLSAFNICEAFKIDIGRGFAAKWVALIRRSGTAAEQGERFSFFGEGLRVHVPGKYLTKNAMYEVVTDPPDITREDSNPPPPLIVTIQHLKKAMRFDLTGKMGLVKFRIESELNVDRRYFDALGLIAESDENKRQIPFVKSENSSLDEIVCTELVHEGMYSVWAVDRREVCDLQTFYYELVKFSAWLTASMKIMNTKSE